MSKLSLIESRPITAPTLGLYVQVPYCASKCTFCNFSSRVGRDEDVTRYWHALISEIRLLDRTASANRFAHALRGLPVDTIYFGGGTPTLDGGKGLCSAVECLKRRFRVLPDCEITVEATPGSLNSIALEHLKSSGVNRLSVGAQSFIDKELRAVGRLHSAAETWEMICHAREAGFENISLDLIAGLPHQTDSSWRCTLEEVLAIYPEHVSVYIFEVDDRSRLGREVIAGGERYSADEAPDADFAAAAYDYARQTLKAAGYRQYELSNFARPDFESRHNRKYWRLEPYWGFGAGAHSFDGSRRWSNHTEPSDYIDQVNRGYFPVADSHEVASEAQIEEFFFLGLRQIDGVDVAYGEERWGAQRLAPWRPVISDLVSDGWIEESDGYIRLRERAYLVSNEIFERFLLADAERAG